MVNIKNLEIKTIANNRKLINNLNLNINDGDKLAIIGEEGNGKSTLLRAIVNVKSLLSYCSIEGVISTQNSKVGYLEQRLDSSWYYHTALDYLMEFEISNIGIIHKYFSDFNLDGSILIEGQLMSTLSGGEQVKIQLIKILLDSPNLLVLDEPTNNLDMETLEWLEQFILNYNKPIIFVSHDETLLERTANKVLLLEQLKRKTESKVTIESLSYSEFIMKRLHLIDKQTTQAKFERREREEKYRTLMKIKEKVNSELRKSKKCPSNGRIVAKK
ncbi:MAG: ATP-binding cassette domain-containing protein [Candidatus Woesearchaeota archaeon]